MKKLNLIIVFALLLLNVSFLEAKSYGGSGYKSSSSSFSKSSSSSYKPSSSSSKSSYSSSYGSSSTSKPSSTSTSDKYYGSYDSPKSNTSYTLSETEKAKNTVMKESSSKTVMNDYKKEKNPEPVVSKTDTKKYNDKSYNSGYNSGYTTNSYNNERQYKNYNIPSYYNENYNRNYGNFDGFFMGYLISDAFTDLGRFLYHNSNDSGVKEWKKELEKQAQTNQELKQKLDKANKEIAELESNNTKKVAYIPEELKKVEKNDIITEPKEKESSNFMFYLGLIGFLMVLGVGYNLMFVRKY